MGKVTGGKRLKRWAARVKRSRRDFKVEVGFFPDQRYTDEARTPVAYVAASNEFGFGAVRERPFFRAAVRNAEGEMRRNVRKVSSGNLDMRPGMEAAGRSLQRAVRASIDAYRNPDGTNALVDTGRMRRSVDVRTKED